MPRVPTRRIDLFNAKVDRQASTPDHDPTLGPCWWWTACINPDTGYGTFWDGKVLSAHRWSYEHFIGPIPEGLQVDHLCRVRRCVNPNHLEPVSLAENVRRGSRANQTHCIHGHEFTPENTIKRRRGGRGCRSCENAGQRRRKAAKRGY
jgi:hypothetical protein